MPIRRVLGIAAALLLFSLCSYAQSGSPGICPPGTYVAQTGNPKRPYRCLRGKRRPRPKAKRPAPKRPRAQTAARADAQPADPVRACQRFNAEFTSFHKRGASEYSQIAARNRSLEQGLGAQIRQQNNIATQLRRQAFRSRQSDVRRHLSGQARELDKAVRDSKRRLRQMKKEHRAKEKLWKKKYRAKAAGLLGARPASCAVDVVQGE